MALGLWIHHLTVTVEIHSQPLVQTPKPKLKTQRTCPLQSTGSPSAGSPAAACGVGGATRIPSPQRPRHRAAVHCVRDEAEGPQQSPEKREEVARPPLAPPPGLSWGDPSRGPAHQAAAAGRGQAGMWPGPRRDKTLVRPGGGIQAHGLPSPRPPAGPVPGGAQPAHCGGGRGWEGRPPAVGWRVGADLRRRRGGR